MVDHDDDDNDDEDLDEFDDDDDLVHFEMDEDSEAEEDSLPLNKILLEIDTLYTRYIYVKLKSIFIVINELKYYTC
jgi:hypothetical protein